MTEKCKIYLIEIIIIVSDQRDIKMNILDHEDVLNHELELLDIPGETLSHFYIYHSENTAFLVPSATFCDRYQKEFGMRQIKSCGNRVNSQFTVLACVLMKIIFGPQKRGDLLEKLKCTLYSPEIKIDKILGLPARGLSSNIMKKILVEFFQVMQYHQGSCEPILDRYPIVLEIFTLFFRTILAYMEIANAKNYDNQVNANQSIKFILDYFDINYQVGKAAFLLYEEQIGIHIDDNTGITFYGSIGNQAEGVDKEQSENTFNFQENSQNFGLEDEEKKQYAPTPCFGEISEEEVNFNKKGVRKNSLSENKLKMAAFQNKIKEHMIQEENEDQDQQDRRRSSIQGRSSLQNRKTSEDICQKKVYFDFEDHNGQNFPEIHSPNLSSPAEDLDKQLNGLFGIKNSRKNDLRHDDFNPEKERLNRLKMQKIEEATSRSEIMKKNWNKNEQKYTRGVFEPRSNTQADQRSVTSRGSCTCTERKVRKNEFVSNVIDISVRPDFIKKPTDSPNLLEFKLNHKSQYQSLKIDQRLKQPNNQSYKIPSFLMKRPNQKSEIDAISSGFNSSRMVITNPPIFQQAGAPKIKFTYNQRKPEHLMTEPGRVQHILSHKCDMNPRQIWNTYVDKRLNNLQRPPSYF